MDAVALGPLVFPIDRFAVIAGAAAFLTAVWWAGRRGADARLQLWSGQVLLWGFIAARLGHVGRHWDSFAAEPWRAAFFWQGGFWAPAGVAAAGAITAFALWRVPGMTRAALVTAALGLVVWQGVWGLRTPLPEVGPPVQALATLDGGEIDLSLREGRPMVINLWATWCAPCRREMPMMAEVAAGHPGVDFVFANQREGAGPVRRFLADEALDLPIVVLDTGGALARHYSVLGLPATLFVDAGGRVQARHIGEISREAFEAGIAGLAPPR
ncbi:TlpA disulfide reductase family protein [Alkalilacustris brevis]|uniref:TlpA disulfide reductase family protein n=1 Tax=Alkalilacustris brevis TaxID=2026338 RepID=UPI000E0DBA07|nr:TlpA disulfide reductase family protein [Alkalilacustris brevis]